MAISSILTFYETINLDSDSFSPLFNPNPITVIGASDKPGKIGYQSLKTLIDGGFEGGYLSN